MKHLHIIVGKDNGVFLSEAFQQLQLEDTTVLCIEDDFSYGPLRDPEIPFSLLRHQFWQALSPSEVLDAIRDLEEIMAVLAQYKENPESLKVYFWMNNKVNEILAYYFLLFYLKPLLGALHVININGLPFLNDELQLFYPNSFKDINVKGIGKALKLARLITPSEMESDGDEWKLYQQMPEPIRTLKSGKQILAYNYDFIDEKIKDAVNTYPHKKWLRIFVSIKPDYSSWDQLIYNLRLQALINQNIIKVENGNLSIVTL